MTVEPWLWSATVALFIILFAIDFWVVERRPHPFTPPEAARWVIAYVILAAIFGAFIYARFGAVTAGEYAAGYITEYSLSVDNLFVFLILMSAFAVPRDLQHRVLLIGVAIALVLRTGLIFVGAAALERFAVTFFVFGAFLLWTAWKVITAGAAEPDPRGNRFVRLVERRFPVTSEYHGHRLTVVLDGVRHVTPMLLVIVAIGTTDLLFAVDSIPAVFGLTDSAYIVFAVNGFALMGLRQLYFLLNGLLDRLVYLNRGLALILAFIGFKLILEAVDATTSIEVPHIGIAVSLGFIVGTLALTVLASLVAVRRDPSLAARSQAALLEREAEVDEGVALEGLPDDDDEPTPGTGVSGR